MGIWLIVAGLLPALLVVVYFYRSDRFPEPRNAIAGVAVMGVLSILAVIPIQLLLQGMGRLWSFPYGAELFRAFVLAGFVEEFVRFLLLLAVAQSAHFDEPMDGPVYGVTLAMGFAAVENIAYVLDGGPAVAVVRAFTAVPAHAAVGLVMGYLVTLGRFLPRWRREFYALALAIPVAVHGCYDACLMVSEAAPDAAGFQSGLQLAWLVGLILEFDVALRLHRHLAVVQFGAALPWWVGRLPFGRENLAIDRSFRRISGLELLTGADLAALEAVALGATRRDRDA